MEPVESHTKLSVSDEGLEAIRNIPGPVIPVVVIGPYRSGKSFLLNQLLGVGCSKPLFPAVLLLHLVYILALSSSPTAADNQHAIKSCPSIASSGHTSDSKQAHWQDASPGLSGNTTSTVPSDIECASYLRLPMSMLVCLVSTQISTHQIIIRHQYTTSVHEPSTRQLQPD